MTHEKNKTQLNTSTPPEGEYRAEAPTENCKLPEATPCLVAGIGASAGGLDALEQIFTTLGGDCDMALVVVMHMPAEGPSFLADILKRYTPMPILTAEEGMCLRPNTVYVSPPGWELLVAKGTLRLSAPGRTNQPINRFFTCLAEQMGEHAIAVVLSGMGLDGVEGVMRIRERGGIVIVQQPESTLYPSMPRNVITTGAAHLVLPLGQIALKLSEIARGACDLPRGACRPSSFEESLKTTLAIVKKKTGHDFSAYKKTTVLRRIERRMAVRGAGGLGKYIAILKESKHEAQTLYREILIGVTGFFRDEGAFKVLRETVIPCLFAGHSPQEPVRIWLPCCATGEEAYSVAILILEYLRQEGRSAKVQLFATDIDEAAVAEARNGRYGDDVVQEVGEERLKTFFIRSEGRWQCNKELRQMILFAHHSVLKDPPFSRLDLLVCRNFLIYLDPDMQNRLISLFHMVLKPHGYLFLGASETVGRNSELFTPVDKKWKIFQRLESSRSKETFFPFSSPVRKLPRIVAAKTPESVSAPSPSMAAERLLMERYCPPCVVVNEKYETLHVSTRTQPYLEIPVGEPTLDILRMAREELRPALRAAIYKAFTEKRPVSFQGVKLTGSEQATGVDVKVEPLAADATYGKLVLVILEPAVSAPASPSLAQAMDGSAGDESSKETLVHQLEEQLHITNEQLQATMEQLESSNEGFMSANEELMSINEEFQSANEELQSTNEELETSKEELQALNEELITVNAELQGKVEELNQANGDMENLFASSGIATIFLDRQLTIKRFSPAMAGILNLIPADVGRPFRHLSGTIDWSGLPDDAHEVLETLIPIEREVSSLEDSRRFIMRVLPYRTVEGNIDGVVVTLVDITDLKRAEEEIRSAALFPSENPSPILRIQDDGTVLFSNRAAESLLSTWRSEFGKDLPDALLRCIKAALADGKIREYEANSDGRCTSFAVAPLPERRYANLYGHDVTDRKEAEEALRHAKEEWERTFDSVPDLIAILDNHHRMVRVNQAMAQRLGTSPEACIGQPCYQCVHGAESPPSYCPHVLTGADGQEHMAQFHEAHLGGDFLVTTTPLRDAQDRMIGAVHVARDISEQKKAEAEIRQQLQELERFNSVSVGRELRMIELKKEINELFRQAGKPPRYPLKFEED